MPGVPLQTLAIKIQFPGEDLILVIDLSYTIHFLLRKKVCFLNSVKGLMEQEMLRRNN